MAAPVHNLKSDVQHVQLKFSLDLKTVLSEIDDFSKNEFVQVRHAFCGAMLTVKFYPKGNCNNESDADSTSLVIRLDNADELSHTDKSASHKLSLEFWCGKRHRRFERTSDKGFQEGMRKAIHDWCPLDELKNNPIITVIATMYCNAHEHVSVHLKHDFLSNCELLDYLSRREGDITLQINVANEDNDMDEADEDNDQLQPPPEKKRKLNGSQNEDASLSDDERKQGGRGDETNTSESNTSKMQDVRVSSILLKAASPVFKRMLESNMVESQEKKIIVNAGSVDAVNDMLYFLWTNKFQNPLRANVFHILRLAHFYQMERLKIAIVNHIIRGLTADNFVDVVNNLNKLSIQEGMNAIVEFAQKNRKKIIERQECANLPFIFRMTVLKMGK